MDEKLLVALRKASIQLYNLSTNILDENVDTLEEIAEELDNINAYINYILNLSEVESSEKDPEDAVAFFMPVLGGVE
jgi:MoaA/NifB/PqqE/SkfB family radical SAM enzyme